MLMANAEKSLEHTQKFVYFFKSIKQPLSYFEP